MTRHHPPSLGFLFARALFPLFIILAFACGGDATGPGEGTDDSDNEQPLDPPGDPLEAICANPGELSVSGASFEAQATLHCGFWSTMDEIDYVWFEMFEQGDVDSVAYAEVSFSRVGGIPAPGTYPIGRRLHQDTPDSVWTAAVEFDSSDHGIELGYRSLEGTLTIDAFDGERLRGSADFTGMDDDARIVEIHVDFDVVHMDVPMP